MAQKWEYQFVYLQSVIEKGKLFSQKAKWVVVVNGQEYPAAEMKAMFNKLGDDGWELVVGTSFIESEVYRQDHYSIPSTTMDRYIFKRPKP